MRKLSTAIACVTAPLFFARFGMLGCGPPPSNSVTVEHDDPARAPVLFVGNAGEGTITLIHAETWNVLGKLNVIPDGSSPRDPGQAVIYPAIVAAKGVNFVQGIAVSSDGQTVYVSRGYLGDVVAIELASGALRWRTQMPGLRADHLTLSPAGTRLFVSAITANVVEALDVTRGEVVGEAPVATYPHVLRFTPDGKSLAVGLMGDTSASPGNEGYRGLAFVDPVSLVVQRTVALDAGVRPFVFTPDGSTLYVQLSLFNGLAAISSSGEILRRVELPILGPAIDMKPSEYPNHAAHHGIALSGDGRTLCVSATVSNYVALVDRATLAAGDPIPVPDQPAAALTSADGKYCFVSNRGPAGHCVSVISFRDRREVARIEVGTRPQELAEASVLASTLRRAPLTR